MRMDGQIRVRTANRHADLYVELRNLAVGDQHELFFICACLGYQRKCSRPLSAQAGERFWSRTITPEEWTCYYAMVLEENAMNFESIQDDEKVIARIEEYAYGGLEVLIQEFLCDFLARGNGPPRLDSSHEVTRELPKLLLGFVWQISQPLESAKT